MMPSSPPADADLLSLLTGLGFQHVEHANPPHRAVLPSDHLF
ncbi:MAG: hypothetical protein AB7V57_12940 [Verrucomicrobiales bacterium]